MFFMLRGLNIAAYQIKSIARVLFAQWKKNTAEDVPIVSWVVFENVLMVGFIRYVL